MTSTIKTIALAASVAVAGAAASAATLTSGGALNIGDDASIATNIAPTSSSVGYTFTALEDMRVNDFISVSATGNQSGASIAQLTFGYTGASINDITGATLDSTIILPGSTTAFGGGTLPGFILRTGESFTFEFQNGSASTVAATMNFTTAAVPLPAGGLLLLTALAGAGAVARRKKKAQKA
ncbi:VPLPA-CTERM sorting domain-containing protein [Jannaschia sp. 2305UL9-9]|uniref:VPLPA-CTERM sorting domain-containing protein n=1 Tax=Jannaschia sp. 2305UL9-9 TaxID=3121638 RepID=UPI003528C9B6